MELQIPPGISDSTVDLMTTSITDAGASVGKFIEVGGLDVLEIGSRWENWLVYLCKTIPMIFITDRIVVTTKTDIPTSGSFKTLFHDLFFYYFPLLKYWIHTK